MSLANIYNQKEYSELPSLDSKELTKMFDSGMVVTNPKISEMVAVSQGTFDMPAWNDLDADIEPNGCSDQGDDATPNGTSQVTQKARVFYWNQFFGEAQLVTQVATSSPMISIKNKFNKYWTRNKQKLMVSMISGIIADNIKDHNSDMGVVVEEFTSSAIVDAAYTLGDATGDISGYGCHSSIMAKLEKEAMLKSHYDQETHKIMWKTLNDKIIVADDSLKDANGNPILVAYGVGAFSYGETTHHDPAGLDVEKKAFNGGGNASVYERKIFTLHPNGFDYKLAEAANETPKLADFRAGGAYARKLERKQIPIAFLVVGAKKPETDGTIKVSVPSLSVAVGADGISMVEVTGNVTDITAKTANAATATAVLSGTTVTVTGVAVGSTTVEVAGKTNGKDVKATIAVTVTAAKRSADVDQGEEQAEVEVEKALSQLTVDEIKAKLLEQGFEKKALEGKLKADLLALLTVEY